MDLGKVRFHGTEAERIRLRNALKNLGRSPFDGKGFDRCDVVEGVDYRIEIYPLSEMDGISPPKRATGHYINLKNGFTSFELEGLSFLIYHQSARTKL